MEEKQHDIIEVCRRRKEEFRLPLPVDGWERLEADLQAMEKPVRRQVVWWRWLAAAALLAGITFSGWWLWQMPEIEPLPEEVVTATIAEEVRPVIPEVEVLPLAYLSVREEEISLHAVAVPEEKKESRHTPSYSSRNNPANRIGSPLSGFAAHDPATPHRCGSQPDDTPPMPAKTALR